MCVCEKSDANLIGFSSLCGIVYIDEPLCMSIFLAMFLLKLCQS